MTTVGSAKPVVRILTGKSSCLETRIRPCIFRVYIYMYACMHVYTFSMGK